MKESLINLGTKLTSNLKKLTKKNLLVIKVKDIDSVPEVIYEGKKILYKKTVNLSWETQGIDFNNGYDFEIKYYKKNKRGLSRLENIGFRNLFKK